MFRKSIATVAVLLAASLSGAHARGVGVALTAAEIAYIDSLFAESASLETPGAAVGIVRAGRLAFAKGYGSASLEHQVPITTLTAFHVASDAKRFTALAILELEAAGALQRDDDIRSYLPELPKFGSTITIRHLLNHTSGLRDQWQLLGLSGVLPPDAVTTEHVLKLVANQEALNFQPGEQFMYCNTGFTLLAEIASRAAGEPFAAYVNRVVFAPLGMRSTRFIESYQAVVPDRALSYSGADNLFTLEPLNYAVPGATSLLTTVDDLSRWIVHANERYKIGDESDPYTQLLTEDTTSSGESVSHGYGVAATRYRGAALLGHGGNDAGFASYFARLPELGAGVIVLANTPAVSPAARAFELIDHLFFQDLLPAVEPEREQPPLPSHEPDSFEQYLGTYRLETGERLNVVQEFWWLAVGPAGSEKYRRLEALPGHPYSFQDTSTGQRYRFLVVEPSSKATEVQISPLAGRSIRGERAEPTSKGDQSLEGSYYSPELETSWQMTLRNGHLELSHPRAPKLEFSRVADDHYEGGTWFANRIVFLRDEHGATCGALISARRITNVAFRRRGGHQDPSDCTPKKTTSLGIHNQ